MHAWLYITAWFAAAGSAAVAPPVTRPLPNRSPSARGLSVAPAADFSLSVSPATITFTATNPNSAPVDAGSSAASVSWTNLDFNTGNWNLTVQSGTTSFSNCPDVPVSAVTVSCASVSTSLGGSGSCSAPFALSTSPQVAAGGTQALFTYSYSVTLNFTLSDNWKYVAETSPSCSLSLSYLATVP